MVGVWPRVKLRKRPAWRWCALDSVSWVPGGTAQRLFACQAVLRPAGAFAVPGQELYIKASPPGGWQIAAKLLLLAAVPRSWHGEKTGWLRAALLQLRLHRVEIAHKALCPILAQLCWLVLRAH